MEPPLIERLAVTVVSGNFNSQRAKLTSDGEATGYLMHPYDDMYWWNSLNRFTHPEALVMTAPRTTCVEYGRQDGITTPAWTERAWKQVAAVRDRLALDDRITLADFDGVHEIHGIGAFDVLDRWLRPGRSVGRDYQYTMLEKQTPSVMGAFLTGVEPFVLHVLNAKPETRLASRFWIPEGARIPRHGRKNLARGPSRPVGGPIWLRAGQERPRRCSGRGEVGAGAV